MKKHKGSFLLEVMFAIAILSFMLTGLFSFIGHLMVLSKQINMYSQKVSYPFIYYCYSPLIDSIVIDNLDNESLIMKKFSINHGAINHNEFKNSDSLCSFSFNNIDEKNILIYCMGNKENEKK